MNKSENMLPIEINICPMTCLMIGRVSPSVKHDGHLYSSSPLRKAVISVIRHMLALIKVLCTDATYPVCCVV